MSAEQRLRDALNRVGWSSGPWSKVLDDELVINASKSPKIDEKIKAFNDFYEEKKEAKKQAEEELGADFTCSWDWYVMPEDEVIKTLTN